ncbi:MAG: lysophospholipid acyltransferase family protein [Actinomycetota bacterium]
MTAVRSLLFALLFYPWTVGLCVLYLPLLVLPRKLFLALVRLWLRGSHLILRATTGIRWQLVGAENLPAGAAIVAAKHQSAFETLVFHLILADPAFILKRELTQIPIFGWHLQKAGCVAIDRSAGTKALKAMVAGAEAAVAEGRTIVIFPEGTRTAPGSRQPYHSGVAMLYGALGVPVVPVALNSGVLWGRQSFTKRAGTITIEVLPPIAPGMDRKAFMAELENRIETASDRLAGIGSPN